MYLQSDWVKRYETAAAIEKDLRGFKYRGQGWYFSESDTLLVMYETFYLVYCWNQPDAYQATLKLLALPFH